MDVVFVIMGIVGFIILVLLLNYWYCVATISHETITVSDKGVVVNAYSTGEGGGAVSRYMIYTTNGQAIANTNNIWFWKWRSDELQGKLKKGRKYKIKTWGVRIPWLGLFKHIISATEIKTSVRKKSGKNQNDKARFGN